MCGPRPGSAGLSSGSARRRRLRVSDVETSREIAPDSTRPPQRPPDRPAGRGRVHEHRVGLHPARTARAPSGRGCRRSAGQCSETTSLFVNSVGRSTSVAPRSRSPSAFGRVLWYSTFMSQPRGTPREGGADPPQADRRRASCRPSPADVTQRLPGPPLAGHDGFVPGAQAARGGEHQGHARSAVASVKDAGRVCRRRCRARPRPSRRCCCNRRRRC